MNVELSKETSNFATVEMLVQGGHRQLAQSLLLVGDTMSSWGKNSVFWYVISVDGIMP